RNFIFDIYGDGPEKEALEALVSKLGLSDRIFFKGYIANQILPEILIQYDIFMMPSYPETLGRVYFEAMACGLPVIGSVGTGIDGLIEDGVQGFLVDTRDNGFNDKINSILSKIISQ